MDFTSLTEEFEKQKSTLLRNNYPALAGLSERTFLQKLQVLEPLLNDLHVSDVDFEKGLLPFVIVIKSNLIKAELMMQKVIKDGKSGTTVLRPHTSENFNTLNEIDIPKADVYLMTNIDRGKKYINVPPVKALQLILENERSPLTIDEGIAVVTHFPEFLMKNNCFSLLASRTGTDRRVPAIWINAKKQLNLGWCWDGNPHTWLGSVSCSGRLS